MSCQVFESLIAMRTSRLLAILLLLESRGRLTATELAGTLEVSLRTVYRDMEQLGVAGVPVYGERGRDGGYRLVAWMAISPHWPDPRRGPVLVHRRA